MPTMLEEKYATFFLTWHTLEILITFSDFTKRATSSDTMSTYLEHRTAKPSKLLWSASSLCSHMATNTKETASIPSFWISAISRQLKFYRNCNIISLIWSTKT